MSLIIAAIPFVIEQDRKALMRTGEFAKLAGIEPKMVRELCERKHNPMPSGRLKPSGHIYVKTKAALDWLENNIQIDGIFRMRRDS